jgi:hypothetical protein
MSPLLYELRDHAPTLHAEIRKAFEQEFSESYDIHVRVRMIAFRDYRCDDVPMLETVFYTEDESSELSDMIRSRCALGGGDLPESSPEALALAIRSDWVQCGSNRRHFIVLLTDALPVPLGESAFATGYPEGIMPSSLKELIDRYDGKSAFEEDLKLDQNEKRLILFTPDQEPWKELSKLKNAVHVQIGSGGGLAEFAVSNMIELMCRMENTL